MTLPLFDDDAPQPPQRVGDGVVLLRHWATAQGAQWVAAVQQVLAQRPWGAAYTAGGLPMSVQTTCCGALGWGVDAHGYCYSPVDLATGLPWPAMPDFLLQQAVAAAAAAGYPGFAPDVCLINRYRPGAKMGLHRDNDEYDMAAPIVSVSLGLPAGFRWGGLLRNSPVRRWTLQHGDVLVWGGGSRLVYHGVSPLADGRHHLLGAERWNLTFRMARARYVPTYRR